MPRTARIVCPGYMHHITQRGNNRQPVFYEDNDYILYLKRIEQYRKKFEVEIYAYCLMPNHVHFIVKPQNKESLAKMFSSVHMRYAQYVQKKYGFSGHIWQGRFYSCLLCEDHLKEAVRYVELNPVRAKIVPKAWEYPWSSTRFNMGTDYNWITLMDIKKEIEVDDWREYLEQGEKKEALKEIRSATKKCFVWGSRDFLSSLQKKVGLKMVVGVRGKVKYE